MGFSPLLDGSQGLMPRAAACIGLSSFRRKQALENPLPSGPLPPPHPHLHPEAGGATRLALSPCPSHCDCPRSSPSKPPQPPLLPPVLVLSGLILGRSSGAAPRAGWGPPSLTRPGAGGEQQQQQQRRQRQRGPRRAHGRPGRLPPRASRAGPLLTPLAGSARGHPQAGGPHPEENARPAPAPYL